MWWRKRCRGRSRPRSIVCEVFGGSAWVGGKANSVGLVVFADDRVISPAQHRDSRFDDFLQKKSQLARSILRRAKETRLLLPLNVAQKLPNGGGLADVNQGSGWRGNLNRGGKTHRIVVVLDKTCTLAISGGNKPIRKRPKASKPALCFQVERSLSALLKKRVRLGASTPLWLCELLFVPPPCRVRDRF